MKKKWLKIIGLSLAIVVIIILAVFANAFVGNPLSKFLVTQTAKKHLAETYPGKDYIIDRVIYNFKDGNYHANILSPNSIDSHFTLSMTPTGDLRRDTYQEDVVSRWNTAQRIDKDYRDLTDKVFEDPAFPYDCDICFGILEIYPKAYLSDPDVTDIPAYALNQDSLILDHNYDIRDLGKKAGHLIVYVGNETVTVEKASEIILDLKAHFDQADIPFHTISFTIQYPKPESVEGPWREDFIGVENFLYTDIHPEGMVDRVRQADQALKAYYAEQDVLNKE